MRLEQHHATLFVEIPHTRVLDLRDAPLSKFTTLNQLPLQKHFSFPVIPITPCRHSIRVSYVNELRHRKLFSVVLQCMWHWEWWK